MENETLGAACDAETRIPVVTVFIKAFLGDFFFFESAYFDCYSNNSSNANFYSILT